MNILLTGGLGFIGSHAYSKLSPAHNVRIADRMVGDDIRMMSHGDYAMPNPDVIVHLAAVADIKDNWTTPENRDGVWSHNVDGTMRLLECFPRTPVIFASSAAVYGHTAGAQASEDNLPRVTSPYAASKLTGEHILAMWGEKYGVKHHVLRLTCTVGDKYAHGHIHDFVRQMREEGHVSAKSTGYPKRTHIHVKDVISAIEGCVTGQVQPGVYNVGSGSWSCQDTARTMGLKPQEIAWGYDDRAWAGDVQVITSHARLMSQGWRSMHTIEAGVRDALKGLGWSR